MILEGRMISIPYCWQLEEQNLSGCFMVSVALARVVSYIHT